MSSLQKDLRYTWRNLRSSPGFSLIAIVTIALAIGANTAMFSFVDGMLLNPLPYPESDRIVRVLERRPDGGNNGISTLNYLDWAEQNTVFEHMAARTGWQATLTGGDQPLQLPGSRVSPGYFEIYGTQPAIGRGFLPDEGEPGNDHVVVITNAFWESQYGSDPSIVNREILLNGEAYTVVGVLPAGGAFDRSPTRVYKPLAFAPSEMTRDFHWFGALGKLKPGVTLEQARAEMELIGARISDAYPDSNKDWSVAVDPLADVLLGDQLKTAVIVLFAATGFVLLIGCANLASLALARGLSREREVAVRATLGAGRWRLMRQFLTENVVLALAGSVLGIGVGYATLKWIQSMIPPFALPAELDIRVNGAVMLFALGVAIATGVLFGLAPALQATRADLAGIMKEGAHGSTPGSPGRRLRGALVIAEVALAFVLLVGSGLLMRSVFSLLDVDPGFDSANVLTASLPVSQQRYPDGAALNAYLDSIQDAVRAVPGVLDVGVTSALPLRGWGYGMPFQIEGHDLVDRANRSGGFFKMVSPSYFRTLGIEFRAGRALGDTDTAGAPPVAIVNETMARRDFADENPIGQRVLVQQIMPGRPELGPEIPWEIVGVIADEKIGGLDDDDSGGLYVSYRQSPVYNVSLVVRAGMAPENLQRALRAAIDGVDRDQPLDQVMTLEQIETQSVTSQRVQSILLGMFAAIALVLAAIGIYGVISYAIEQRTHEIGIRAALGANAGRLRRLVFVSGMRLALAGLALGLVASLAMTRVMASLLFGVGSRDPLTLAAVPVILGAVAALACYVPARRATRVDPMVALRFQ